MLNINSFKNWRPGWRSAHKGQEILPERESSHTDQACRKLLQAKTMVMACRLQLLGSEEFMKCTGQRGQIVPVVLHEVCRRTIQKFLLEGDISVRHEESYILLFPGLSLHEAEIRGMLIAEEIKCQLIEYDKFENIEIFNQISNVDARSMPMDVLPFPDYVHYAFERSLSQKPQDFIFVESDKDSVVDEDALEADIFVSCDDIEVQYLPVWDQYKGRLISYMCLAVDPQYMGNHPFIGHQKACQAAGLPVVTDVALLRKVVSWMDDHPDQLGGFGLICPVHYETLAAPETQADYYRACQAIGEHLKPYILFMVLGVPNISWLDLVQTVSPLKSYGRVLCAEIDLNDQPDYEFLRLAGFDHAGVVLETSAMEGRMRKTVADIRHFVTKARKSLIHKTFVLGVNDPVTATHLAQTGVRFMVGSAVHEGLQAPQAQVDFYKNPSFRSWQETAWKRRMFAK